MSRELATTTATPSSLSPAEHRRGGGERLPLGKLLDPLRWYCKWVRANPEGASSLEQFSRTLTMLWSDPTNLITSEACFTLCKLHTFSNFAIISSGGRRTSKTELLSLVLRGIQEVECLMELIHRNYAGHRRTWNALLLLEAVKCTLKACVHRQLFLVPWLWDFAAWASGAGVVGTYAGPLTQVDYSGGSGGLCGEVVGPHNTRLVIPRVASGRRHEHRHVYRAGASCAADEGEEHVTFAQEGDVDEELEEAEAIGFTWVDVLGMILDMYLLLRPVLLVAMARHAFLALPEETTNLIAVLPPPVSKEEMAAAAEAAAKAAEEAKKTGTPVKPTPGPDPLAALHKAMAAAPQQTLLGSWRVWAGVTGCDFLVALLARLVRHHRVPVVYIKDNAESDDGGTPVALLEGGEAASIQGGGADAADGFAASSTAVTGATDSRAIGAAMEPPVVSRDHMRVQQALRNALYNVMRDPFFTAVLKQLVYHHFIRGFVSRVPLLGTCISFYATHYLSMQYYSFLYTLRQ
ncbi:Peroxisomal membrane protein (Pex16) family protein [Leishmania donovani]|uniref:Peroxisomal membrane protein PEX16 n=1 Tax=Leishmania donovani TaxID=5661 RepID=A0A504Y6R3_LEIDO|nr:Peroxisomal membrane protein (Pex16) family protein [Leishmania donovani]